MTPEELEAEFIRLSAAGELDNVQWILRSRRHKVPREVVREIVQEACLELVHRQQDGGRITHVAGLIMTIAGRLLGKAWQQTVDGFGVDAAFAVASETAELVPVSRPNPDQGGFVRARART